MLFQQWKKRYCYPDSVTLMLIISIFVYSYFHIAYDYIAKPQLIWEFGYSEIIVFLIFLSLLLSIWNHYRKKSFKANPSLVPFELDRPIEDNTQDLLNHETLANHIADRVKASTSPFSFSVALIAPWGSGKSSFINMMISCFEPKDFLIVRFNPRHASSGVSISQSFFDTLNQEISEYDGQFSTTLNRYLESISIVDNGITSKFLNALQLTSDNINSMQNLSRIIKRHWRKIIVVMEDFDRLTSDELIETLKLIDGNAAINGLVFMCAFDKKNISLILEKHGQGYIDKYFDIEYSLPHRPYAVIFKYLEDKLTEILGNDDVIKAEINNCQKHFQKHLPTFRDAKRYVNNVSISYPYVKGDVEIYDFLLVEILKLIHHDSYPKLKEENLAATWPSLEDNQEEVLSKSFESSWDIIKSLLNRTRTSRSFNNPTHYFIYIWNYVYGKLRYQDLIKLMDPSESFEKDFSNYLSNGSKEVQTQVYEFINQYYETPFETAAKFERYVQLVIFPFKWNPFGNFESNEYYHLVLHLLHEERMKSILSTTGLNEESYKKIITSQLEWDGSGNISAYLTRQLTYSIVTDHSMKKILSHAEILEINKNNLKKYCDINKEYSLFTYQLLLGCVVDINKETNIVKLDPECCILVKETILTNPGKYFDRFVFLTMESSSEYYNEIGCDGFWRQIFGSAQEIERVINSLPAEYLLVRNFWTLFSANQYDSIPFDTDGNVQSKIDRNLVDEISRYELFCNLRNDFNKNTDDYQMGLIDVNKYVDCLNTIRDKIIKDVRLNITQVNRLLKDVSEFLDNHT